VLPGQEDRKRSQFGFRVNGIAKSDVDLHWNPRSGQMRQERGADAIILVILSNLGAPDRCGVEYKPVFALNLADCPDCLLNLADSG
jgi:hypothetical protein